jgi:hypothetical protein
MLRFVAELTGEDFNMRDTQVELAKALISYESASNRRRGDGPPCVVSHRRRIRVLVSRQALGPLAPVVPISPHFGQQLAQHPHFGL